MVTEPFAPSPPRRGRRLLVAGVVVAVLSLVVVVTSGVLLAMSVGTPVSEAFTSPSRPTPVDAQLSLRAGKYTVFELVGRRSGQGPITTTSTTAPTVTPEAIAVTGPDGVAITAHGYTSGSETLTRERDIYAGVARFVVAEPGEYHVRIDSPADTRVVVAPSFGTGFGAALKWVLAGLASFVALLAGVVLIVVGAVRGRRRPAQVAQPAGLYSGRPFGATGTPAGWYRAPDVANRERYWNGHSWTEHLR
jgi:hypothetical protein